MYKIYKIILCSRTKTNYIVRYVRIFIHIVARSSVTRRWREMGNNIMTAHIIFYSVTYRCYNYYILFYAEKLTHCLYYLVISQGVNMIYYSRHQTHIYYRGCFLTRSELVRIIIITINIIVITPVTIIIILTV